MPLSHIFKRIILIVVLTIVQSGHSYACDGLSQSEGPKIIKISVKGVNEFAQKFEEFTKVFPNTLFLTDGDGVYTRFSEPRLNIDDIICPRGDMPVYLAYLHEVRNILIILASAWNKPKETFARVERHHLGPTFNLHETVEEGTKKFGKDAYTYIKKGNVISVKRVDPLAQYFRQKAFAPSIVFGDDFTCDQLIFIDDSKGNRKIFEKDIVETPLYSKLKQIVIFEIPEINGEILKTDIIDEAYLPISYKEKWITLCEKKVVSPVTTTEQTEKKDSVLKRSSGACGLEEAKTSSLKSSSETVTVEGTS